MLDPDTLITAKEVKALFAPFAAVPAIVLAVSGGPDSTALLVLAARWRQTRNSGPKLIAVTVDHGLRKESAAEARAVKTLAASRGVPHVTKRWRGDKPKAGLPAAARAARYALLGKAARAAKATHILTAHTQDDQAETLLMRLAKGSGLTGLAAMAPVTPRGDLHLARPFLGVPKARLIATLDNAGIAYASDPANTDPAYLRPRLRAVLEAEGMSTHRLARLAARMARADAALERMTDGAERYLHRLRSDRHGFDADAFHGLPDELRVRLLQRAIARIGNEGLVELGKVESLAVALDQAARTRAPLRRTLAGALISLGRGRLTIAAAPPRRPAKR